MMMATTSLPELHDTSAHHTWHLSTTVTVASLISLAVSKISMMFQYWIHDPMGSLPCFGIDRAEKKKQPRSCKPSWDHLGSGFVASVSVSDYKHLVLFTSHVYATIRRYVGADTKIMPRRAAARTKGF